MTLLHTLVSARLAVLRQPPHDPDPWPERITLTADDVLVDGRSLRTLATRVETPFVVTCAPEGSVLLVSVDVLVPRLSHSPRQAWVDADLSSAVLRQAHARVLGRHSDHLVRTVLRSAYLEPRQPLVRLPRDLRAGDVLAVPCVGDLSVSDLAP